MSLTPAESIARLREWHDKWCDRLDEFARSVGVEARRPSFHVSAAGTRWSGQYRGSRERDGRHECWYALPYVLVQGCCPRCERTVAHECCHAYQREIMQEAQWHGDLFKFLLRVVCGFGKTAGRFNGTTQDEFKRVQLVGKLLVNSMETAGRRYEIC